MKLELLTRAENMQLLFSDMETLIKECDSESEVSNLYKMFQSESKIIIDCFDARYMEVFKRKADDQ